MHFNSFVHLEDNTTHFLANHLTALRAKGGQTNKSTKFPSLFGNHFLGPDKSEQPK